MKNTTLFTNPIHRWPSRRGVLVAFAGVMFALSSIVRAVDPPPDGGYPGNNTAEGEGALFSLDTSQGTYNTAIGFHALYNNTTGYYNTATGSIALFSNTTGFYNTATGISTLYYNTTGEANTALGSFALLFNTTGGSNTATGTNALYKNTTGNNNTATGALALDNNTTGSNNTATGLAALSLNTIGNNNTANGGAALENNTTGSFNTATGYFALFYNTTGNNNTANGYLALESNTIGFNNTATGVSALSSNTTGNYCTATGQGSLSGNTTGRNNTATGQNAMRNNTTGSFNVALGDNAGFNLTTGNNNIEIGNRGVAGEANTIRIGKQGTQAATFIAGMSGAPVTGTAVVVSSSGQLGVAPSSQRFKQNIRTMGDASNVLLALRPVTFEYKPDVDPKGVSQFGLVAEEVEKVNPNLVAHDDEGKPFTVRYEAVNAMLLNEFLKEHRRVEEQEKRIDALTVQLKEQAALIQKVNDKIEMNKPVPQTALNDQ